MKIGLSRGPAAVAAAALAAGIGLTGCHVGNVNLSGAQKAIGRAEQSAKANKSTVSQFTQALKSGAPAAFEVTYVTTGAAPTTVLYAAQPPSDLVFTETPVSAPGRVQVQLIANSSGEFSCQSGDASPLTCKKLDKLDALAQNQIVDIYTPSHWVTLLQGFSVAAGFAGGKVTTSTMTVNGFSLSCINIKTTSSSQLNTICTTPQNLLGYAKLAGATTAFEIKSYSATPSPSLFTLPRGAKLTPASQAG